MRRWQYGSELDTTWLVGGPIRFRAKWQVQNFEQSGTVLEFDAPSHLRYSLFAPRPELADRSENYFTMTYDVVKGPFDRESPIVVATPCGSNSAAATCPAPSFPANYLAKLDLKTGTVTPITMSGSTFVPQGGLAYVARHDCRDHRDR